MLTISACKRSVKFLETKKFTENQYSSSSAAWCTDMQSKLRQLITDQQLYLVYCFDKSQMWVITATRGIAKN